MKGVRGVKNQGVSEGSMSTDRDDYDFDWATQEFESCHSDQQKRRHQPSFFVGRKGRSVPCDFLCVPNQEVRGQGRRARPRLNGDKGSARRDKTRSITRVIPCPSETTMFWIGPRKSSSLVTPTKNPNSTLSGLDFSFYKLFSHSQICFY